MTIKQLAYLGIETAKPATWQTYASDFLGLEVTSLTNGSLALRMDERRMRMLVEPGQTDRLSFVGFEVEDEAALHTLAERCQRSGFSVREAAPQILDTRSVRRLLETHDPDGNRVEFFCGPLTGSTPVRYGRPIGGFKTGELGLGHITWQTTRYAEMLGYYQDLLGFGLSDSVDIAPFRASFLHTNPRHHTLAIAEANEAQLHHAMIEYQHLDDVGRLYDMALKDENSIAVSLGRHSNDHMLSFYSITPSGFFLELGWAGRTIDPATWKPETLCGPSIWGHDRRWLPPEARAQAARKLEEIAALGVREPVAVDASPGFDLHRLQR